MSHAETLPPDWAEAIAGADNPFHVAITRYARAPIAFVREVLHAEPDAWQIEALRAVARGHTRIAIRSGHGVGKSCLAAWLVTWFANTRAPFKCAITAPSAPQMFDVLLARVGEMVSVVTRRVEDPLGYHLRPHHAEGRSRVFHHGQDEPRR